jgi:alpha-D-ribose 1-methylphosphonate 5-triphosphate diphosphatase
MKELILTNASLVLANEVINGTLTIANGVIKSIDHGNVSTPSAIDLEGQYLLPGLVELHTDNLEKHFTPRPKVTWPGQPAVIAHDAQLVAAGITTVFDAISLGDVNENSQRLENLRAMVEAITNASKDELLRAEHLLHLRCEVSNENVVHLFEEMLASQKVHLVSLMDHSPGQRQFTKMDKYRIYYQGKYNFNDAELEAFMIREKENSARYSDKNRRKIVSLCQSRDIPMASHDDATLAHVEESSGFGMTIAEFPTTFAAAKSSHEKGMKVLMGAPNVVRGGSHSGNIAAHELAEKGVLDILSSDYCPASILHAAFILENLENDYDLSKAINTVSLNPARSAGLNDRGELAAGKRADMIQVKLSKQMPVVNQAWRQGRRIF